MPHFGVRLCRANMAVEPDQAEAPNMEANKFSLALFRRPDKFKIGEDFDLFIKESNLYFEVVELKDVNKQRFALLFNLSEDAFRLAEPVEFGEGANAYKDWFEKLKVLFERNQTATEYVTIFIVKNSSLMNLLIRMLFPCEKLESSVVYVVTNTLAGWFINLF